MKPLEAVITSSVPVTHAFAYITLGDKILLTQHATRGYQLPGGTREKGESPRDCVIREVKEETGLALECGIREVFVFRTHNRNENSKFPPTGDMLLYKAELLELPEMGDITAPISEIVGAEFRSIDELESLSIWEQEAINYLRSK